MKNSLIAILLVSASCHGQQPAHTDFKDLTANYAWLVNHVFSADCNSIGGGPCDHGKCIYLGFATDYILSLDEMRQWLLAITDILVGVTNDSEAALVYFGTESASQENFRVSLASRPTHDDCDPDYVAFASVLDGRVIYAIAIEPDSRLEKIHQESFEQARALVPFELSSI